MSGHAPKFYALEALEDGKLSEAGTRRIEAHLRACETCTQARQGVRNYRALLAAAAHEDAVELSWPKLEAKLEREPPRASHKWLALAVPALAIAATFVIGWVGLSGQKQQDELARRRAVPSQTQAGTAVKSAAQASLAASVTALAGAPRANETALSLSAVVREGDVLTTGREETLHVRLSGGTGIALWEQSELRIERLRNDEVVLQLIRGGVSNQVAKLAPKGRYLVRAADITAQVRGTRFSVALKAEAISVAVYEGTVAILRGDIELSMLEAGQNWSSAGSGGIAEKPVLGIAPGSETWPTLTLSSLANVRAWNVLDARFSSRSEVSMRAPPGELTIGFEDTEGLAHTLTRTLSSAGSSLSEEDISRVIERDRENRVGTLDPQLITPVVRNGLDGLKRCYEQSLRRAPKLAGKVTLSLRVSSTGQVVRAKLASPTGEKADVGLTVCITGKAATWAFPAPTGGPVNIDLPLNLKSNSP